MFYKIKSLCLFFILLTFINRADSQVAGAWSGNLDAMGSLLKIKVVFSEKEGLYSGNIDIPQQNALGLRLSNISFAEPFINFELEAGPGNIAKFNGELKDSIITGKFSQMGIEGKFDLKRVLAGETILTNKGFHEEEVYFINRSVKLGGTLTLPDTLNKYPAIILVSGSGAQTRDEEIFDFPIFKTMAEYLTLKGFAVLRYDDRGIGESTGKISESTLNDFADDVISAVKFLSERKDINAKQIGIMGHSEGGIVASLAAEKSKDVSYIILLAAPGTDGSSLIIEQTKNILKVSGAPDSLIKAEIKKALVIHNTVIKDEGWDKLRIELFEQAKERFEKAPSTQTSSIENKEIFIANMVENQIEGYKSKWLKSFLSTNPQTVMNKVTCPVLALFGDKDSQVNAATNSKNIISALKKAKNKNYEIKIFPNANHLFQQAKTGLPNEYQKLKKEFIPGFLEYITKWLTKTTAK